MSTQEPFTIEQFYKFMTQKKLMAGRCLKCGKIHLPPRLLCDNCYGQQFEWMQISGKGKLCDNCYGQQFEWMQISGKGKLVTYTVIHVAPQQFQALTPYAVGIVQLENGLRIPGMIPGLTQEQLKIGLELTLDFGTCSTSQTWPQWQRYCFEP